MGHTFGNPEIGNPEIGNPEIGNPENSLLVSLRSGALVSMPGMMDSVLNLGLNDEVVEGLARQTGNPRFAYDAYRRPVDMCGDVVVGINRDGLGELVKLGTENGRRVNPGLSVGICGEHGGERASVRFCHEADLNCVSCSPFRAPIARLATA